MSSDRARDSYDATRQYRGIVKQQGRVTVEADDNEGGRIAGENLLRETLDIVGSCGTPDDGFAVTMGGPMPDFVVGPGTMYVGGLRVTQTAPVHFAEQPEWLDTSGDPLWSGGWPGGNEFVYLFLREQEVTAVEDQVLREVALGGPDTAARTRLVQRIVRSPDGASQCDAALADTKEKWGALGLSFDPSTMRLTSSASLQVKFVQPPVAETQCDPQVKGGYLGADNQMIRVKISAYDPNTGKGKLVWSYNNASFLHRVTALADHQTLELVASPIDNYHTPRSGHAVEILRSAVDLKDANYVAAPNGLVMTLTADYVSDTRQLTLPAALPPDYWQAKGQLFLRMWEFEVPFTPGTPVDLAGTGLQVSIALPGKSGALTVGQYWTFAARPSTPVTVYPKRYLDAPQPPEGPRMWACPLAVIGWTNESFQLVSDCRRKFDDLVELTKRKPCCGVVIRPQDVGGGASLQAFLDDIVKTAEATVSLLPGTYSLPKPLRLDERHAGLTLEGCHDGAWLAATNPEAFHEGLIVLDHANDVTLRRLRLRMPLVRAGKGGVVGGPQYLLFDSTGVQAIHCADLRVEECLFRFELVPEQSRVTAVGLRLVSEIWNGYVERNRFLHDDGYTRGPHMLVGIGAGLEFTQGGRANTAEPPLLENLQVLRNEFGGLTVAMSVRSEMGRLRCQDNRAHGCNGGFYFSVSDQQLKGALYLDAAENWNATPLYTALGYAAQTRLHQAMIDYAKRTPLPKEFQSERLITVGKSVSSARTKQVAAQARALNRTLAEQVHGRTEGQTGHAEKGAVDAIRQQTMNFVTAPATMEETVQHTPAIRFCGNDIDLVPYDEKAAREFDMRQMALLVSLEFRGRASVLIEANDMRGDSPAQLMDVSGVEIAAITGNIVVNTHRSDSYTSMIVIVPEPGVMNVAGNVCLGNFSIFAAPPAVGCDSKDWRLLNSERIA